MKSPFGMDDDAEQVPYPPELDERQRRRSFILALVLIVVFLILCVAMWFIAGDVVERRAHEGASSRLVIERTA